MTLAGPRSFYTLLLAGIGGLVEESLDGSISVSKVIYRFFTNTIHATFGTVVLAAAIAWFAVVVAEGPALPTDNASAE